MSAELVAHEAVACDASSRGEVERRPHFAPDLMRLVVTRGLHRGNLNTGERTQETPNEICD